MTNKSVQEQNEWIEAVDLLCKWESGGNHLDDLLDKATLSRLRWLVMETFRNWLVIERILKGRLKRTPRPQVLQLLRLAVAECLNREAESHPRIVHHAVEVARDLRLSKPEAGFVNAVLRGILRESGDWRAFSLEETHPIWMAKRWKVQFGPSGSDAFLKWNQSVPAMTIRSGTAPAYAESTSWPGYYQIKPSRFREALPDLKAGLAYIQDPFARIPVELLAPQPGETVMDLCAAPGGKTRLIAESMSGKGLLVAVDRPGRRLERLQENLAQTAEGLVRVVGSPVESLESANLPEGCQPGQVDAVLIDVPCSNTGVIQKRPDVKLRLKEGDFKRLAEDQLKLLECAAPWVKPGGRLVYSTCSLEEEENTAVLTAFLKKHSGWKLVESVISLPWECGHDGGGAFLLTRDNPA